MKSLSSSRFGITSGMAAACFAVAMAGSPLFAQDHPTEHPTGEHPKAEAAAVPEAKEVIARYVKAIGGEAAIRSHSSRMMKGQMTFPDGMGGEMSADLAIYSAAPNKMLFEFSMEGYGEMKQGYDGEVAWVIDPMMGTNILDGAELEQMREQADFYSELNFDKRYKSMETIDEREFDGVKCYALKMVDNSDNESTHYFETESGLLRGMSQTQEGPMGPMDMTNINKEFKEFGGVKMPVRTEIEMMGATRVLTFTTVELDSVPAEKFELPADIKALVEKRNAGGDEKPEGEEEEKPEPARNGG